MHPTDSVAATAVCFLDAVLGVLEQAQDVEIHPAGHQPLLLPLETSGVSATADFLLGRVEGWPTRSRTAGLLSAAWAAPSLAVPQEETGIHLPATMWTAFASKASSGVCTMTISKCFGLLQSLMCSLLSLVTAVARTLHPLRSLSSTSLGTVLSLGLLWLLGRLVATGGFFRLRRLVEGLVAASQRLTWHLSAALGDSAYGRTYFSSPLGVDTLWRRLASQPHQLLLVAVRWWLVLPGDLLAVARLFGAAARALDLLLGLFGLPRLGNLSSAATGLGCGAIALDLGPLLAYQASGWMLRIAQDLFLVLWQVLPRSVLLSRHLRLMTLPSCLSRN